MRKLQRDDQNEKTVQKLRVSFPNDATPLNGVSRLPNPFPFRHMQYNMLLVNTLFSRTVRTCNNLLLNPFPNSLLTLNSTVTSTIEYYG